MENQRATKKSIEIDNSIISAQILKPNLQTQSIYFYFQWEWIRPESIFLKQVYFPVGVLMSSSQA